MVKKQRARLEVMCSNPSQRIFCVILKVLGTGYFTRYLLVSIVEAFGTGYFTWYLLVSMVEQARCNAKPCLISCYDDGFKNEV